MIAPTGIRNDENFLYIEWNDGEISRVKLTDLRYNCPCAYCAADRQKYDSDHARYFTQKDIQITEINLTGKYALSIVWADGHNAGFYEFSLLKKLSV